MWTIEKAGGRRAGSGRESWNRLSNHYINIQLTTIFHLALMYAIFYFQIKPMQLNRYIITLLYDHDNCHCFKF